MSFSPWWLRKSSLVLRDFFPPLSSLHLLKTFDFLMVLCWEFLMYKCNACASNGAIKQFLTERYVPLWQISLTWQWDPHRATLTALNTIMREIKMKKFVSRWRQGEYLPSLAKQIHLDKDLFNLLGCCSPLGKGFLTLPAPHRNPCSCNHASLTLPFFLDLIGWATIIFSWAGVYIRLCSSLFALFPSFSPGNIWV